MDEYFDVDILSPCRVCNSLKGVYNILTDQAEDEGVLLHEALEFITCVKIDPDDGISLSLCSSCNHRLLDAFRFKNQALDSCKALGDMNSVDIKKITITDENDVLLQVEISELDDNNLPDGSSLQLSYAKRVEVDMSTDAVSFLIEHRRNNAKSDQVPMDQLATESSTDADWIIESIRQHPKEKYRNYGCQFCEKEFRKKSNLIDHLRLHANVKKFICPYCGKGFVQVANYRTHLRIHTKERPYVCPLCHKSYNQSSTLKVHIRSHTQERNYICTICDKRFTNSSDLGKHKKVHDRSQQFKCEFCDKLFAQKVNMRTHQKKHHFVG